MSHRASLEKLKCPVSLISVCSFSPWNYVQPRDGYLTQFHTSVLSTCCPEVLRLGPDSEQDVVAAVSLRRRDRQVT